MYFTVFGYNSIQQGQLLARDLKLAQLAHLSPKATFTAQMLGCVIGAIFNYVMMESIVTNQYDILTSIEGSNVSNLYSDFFAHDTAADTICRSGQVRMSSNTIPSPSPGVWLATCSPSAAATNG